MLLGERPELGLCCVWTPRIGSMLWANAQDWVSAVGGRPGLDICSGSTVSSAWLSSLHCGRMRTHRTGSVQEEDAQDWVYALSRRSGLGFFLLIDAWDWVGSPRTGSMLWVDSLDWVNPADWACSLGWVRTPRTID
jgi:hypothetical protein